MNKEIVITQEIQDKINELSIKRMEEDYKRKLSNFKVLNKDVKKCETVFVGDSITEGYPVSELHLNKLIYNRGVSAITSKDILTNINDHIIDLNPNKVFLLIGTNDIEKDFLTSDVVSNVYNICKTVENALPKAIIYVISIYPVNEIMPFKFSVGKRTNNVIIDINNKIKAKIATLNNTKFIDLYNDLLTDNNLDETYTYDGLHLNMYGYKKVSKLINNYL